MKLVLIGGHPKGFDEPFHIKTRSGKVLRKITDKLSESPALFDLWKNQAEEDKRSLSDTTKKQLSKFAKNGYTLVSLGRYIEKALSDNGYKSTYLPHPASRDMKYVRTLEKELKKLS